MKGAECYRHRQANKTMQYEENSSKFTYILLKLGKYVDNYTTSTHQKKAANNESLLAACVVKKRKRNPLSYSDVIMGIATQLFG